MEFSQCRKEQEEYGDRSMMEEITMPYPLPEYAGFWIRFVAAFIDGILCLVINMPIVFLFGPDSGISNLLSGVAGLLYYTLFVSSEWQATPGKRALGLAITDLKGQRISFWRALGRYFAQIPSALLLGIGYIMVAFTEKKQGLHDKIAGTLVIKQRGY